jgi:aconitate hydratase
MAKLPAEFKQGLTAKVGFKGYGLNPSDVSKKAKINYKGKEYELGHGSVVIAAITSCTNTSNPDVMLAAGLVAKKAIQKGLKVNPYIKTTLSPGSGVVKQYFDKSGVQQYLDQLGFTIAGYGCMTCIGNSGEIPSEV